MPFDLGHCDLNVYWYAILEYIMSSKRYPKRNTRKTGDEEHEEEFQEGKG